MSRYLLQASELPADPQSTLGPWCARLREPANNQLCASPLAGGTAVASQWFTSTSTADRFTLYRMARFDSPAWAEAGYDTALKTVRSCLQQPDTEVLRAGEGPA